MSEEPLSKNLDALKKFLADRQGPPCGFRFKDPGPVGEFKLAGDWPTISIINLREQSMTEGPLSKPYESMNTSAEAPVSLYGTGADDFSEAEPQSQLRSSSGRLFSDTVTQRALVDPEFGLALAEEQSLYEKWLAAGAAEMERANARLVARVAELEAQTDPVLEAHIAILREDIASRDRHIEHQNGIIAGLRAEMERVRQREASFHRAIGKTAQ